MSKSRCSAYLQFLQAIAIEKCRSSTVFVQETSLGMDDDRPYGQQTQPLYSEQDCKEASQKVLDQAQRCLKELNEPDADKPRKHAKPLRHRY